MTSLEQDHTGVTADEAGASGYEQVGQCDFFNDQVLAQWDSCFSIPLAWWLV